MLMFLQRNWFYVGGVVFAALAFAMGFWGHDHLSHLVVILVYSFMALLAHQFEEYVLPGGAPMVLNAAFYGEKKDYDRYPGNQRNCLMVNLLAYPFYIAAIAWPGAIRCDRRNLQGLQRAWCATGSVQCLRGPHACRRQSTYLRVVVTA